MQSRGARWVLVAIMHVADADLYMHHPRGSNNKLNEVSNNARNQNRLFDSQNNAAGGYQVGDDCNPVCSNSNGQYDSSLPGAGKGVMYFYEESYLHIEWTNQHGCGNAQKNVKCELVLQYTCDEDWYEMTNPDLRDGTTTNTVPATEAGAANPQFGLHEPLAMYQNCLERERNKGLYIADQNLGGNRDRARFTRQNPNGNRRGLECPEERDYYPYWHPTPWRDIAVFTDDMHRCDYYQRESQNRRPKGQCCNRTLWHSEHKCQQVPGYDPTGNDQTPPGPNNRGACTRFAAVGDDYSGVWVEYGNWGTHAPRCERTPFSRDNHLGNSIPKAHEAGELSGISRASSYRWKVPDDVLDRTHRSSATCVLRMRYNISTTDFNSWSIDKDKNGVGAPVKNNPSGDFIGFSADASLGTDFPLKLNMNTNQWASPRLAAPRRASPRLAAPRRASSRLVAPRRASAPRPPAAPLSRVSAPHSQVRAHLRGPLTHLPDPETAERHAMQGQGDTQPQRAWPPRQHRAGVPRRGVRLRAQQAPGLGRRVRALPVDRLGRQPAG